CWPLLCLSLIVSLSDRPDDFVEFRLTEQLQRRSSHVSLRSEGQEIRGKGLIVGGFHLDDEVIVPNGELARLNFNAKFLGHLPCGGSTFRCVLNGAHTLISEVAEKHVRRHDTPSIEPVRTRIMPQSAL